MKKLSILFKDFRAAYDESKLSINQSLEDEKGIYVKDFLLKEILERK